MNTKPTEWQPGPRPVQPRPPVDRSAGLLLARIFGVEVRLDWSLLIIFALVTVNLGAGVIPSWHPSWNAGFVWSGAAIASALLFASLLAHELSHAFVARARGVPVNRVTLFLFGGVAHMEKEPPSPKAEFLIAVVGPITSIGLGVLLTSLGLWLADPMLFVTGSTVEETLAIFRSMGAGVTLLLWLGPLNVLLGVFNLVPGFPLDGGRVLRAVLWASTGDLLKATRWASYVGQAVAFGLIALGLLSLFQGDLTGGLWLGLIGWFLNGAARASYTQLLLRRSLEDVPVKSLMSTRLDRVPPHLTLDQFVRDHVLNDDQRIWPVETEGILVGMVSFDDLRRVPRNAWETATVREVMTPASQLTGLRPDAGAEEALKELSTRETEQIPVVEDGHLLGLVRRKDLLRWLSLHAGPAPG